MSQSNLVFRLNMRKYQPRQQNCCGSNTNMKESVSIHEVFLFFVATKFFSKWIGQHDQNHKSAHLKSCSVWQSSIIFTFTFTTITSTIFTTTIIITITCRAAGLSQITSAACLNALLALCSPSAAITFHYNHDNDHGQDDHGHCSPLLGHFWRPQPRQPSPSAGSPALEHPSPG